MSEIPPRYRPETCVVPGGNDKYGLLHIQASYGRHGTILRMHDGRVRTGAISPITQSVPHWPTRSEWSIIQDNDTFAVYRRMPLPDGRYVFTTRAISSTRREDYGSSRRRRCVGWELRKVMAPPLRSQGADLIAEKLSRTFSRQRRRTRPTSETAE